MLKAYATWCPHCQSKVQELNNLAGALQEFGLAIYAVEVEQNPIFANTFSDVVKGYPTFLQVNNNGEIGGPVLNELDQEQLTVDFSAVNITGTSIGQDLNTNIITLIEGNKITMTRQVNNYLRLELDSGTSYNIYIDDEGKTFNIMVGSGSGSTITIRQSSG